MNNDEQQQLERLFGGNPHLKATLEQACDFDGKDQESAETQPVFRDKQSLLRHVVQRAQSLGTWIERIEDYVKEMIGNGHSNLIDIHLFVFVFCIHWLNVLGVSATKIRKIKAMQYCNMAIFCI